jgi:plastocyanin
MAPQTTTPYPVPCGTAVNFTWAGASLHDVVVVPGGEGRVLRMQHPLPHAPTWVSSVQLRQLGTVHGGHACWRPHCCAVMWCAVLCCWPLTDTCVWNVTSAVSLASPSTNGSVVVNMNEEGTFSVVCTGA